MFNASEKSTGTECTTPVALLFLECVFVPLVLFVSRPFENWFALPVVCVSLLCLVLSWTAWKKTSSLTCRLPSQTGE